MLVDLTEKEVKALGFSRFKRSKVSKVSMVGILVLMAVSVSMLFIEASSSLWYSLPVLPNLLLLGAVTWCVVWYLKGIKAGKDLLKKVEGQRK